MTGLDTNVLLRFVLGDDASQTRVAEEVVSGICSPQQPGFVSLVVVAEFVWVLQRAMHLDVQTTSSALNRLLATESLRIQAYDEVFRATQSMIEGEGDFHDALIGFVSRAQGCNTTLTFDRKAARMEVFTLIHAGSH